MSPSQKTLYKNGGLTEEEKNSAVKNSAVKNSAVKKGLEVRTLPSKHELYRA